MLFCKWKDLRWVDEPEGGLSRTVQFKEFIGSGAWELCDFRIDVAAETLAKWCRLDSGNPGLLQDILRLIERACEGVNGTDCPTSLPKVSCAAQWEFNAKRLSGHVREPRRITAEDYPKPRFLGPEKIRAIWGIDIDDIESQIDRLPKLKRVLKEARNGAPENQRAHLFELKTITELYSDLLDNVILEEEALPIVSKKGFDIGIPILGLHIELYSPEKDPMQFPIIQVGDGEAEIRRKHNKSFFYSTNNFANLQAPAVSKAVVSKLATKPELFSSLPSVLVIDGFFNNLGQNHTTASLDAWAKSMTAEYEGIRATNAHAADLLVVLKWYDMSVGKSNILAFTSSESERGLLVSLKKAFSPDKVRFLPLYEPSCPS
jgi:hypothetical protein